MPFPGVTRFKSAGGPVEVAISPDETFCLVANRDAHNVSRFDLATGELLATYEGGLAHPSQIAISSTGTFCLITSPSAGRVTKLDLRNGAIMGHMDGLDSALGVALMPDNSYALVHCSGPMARSRSTPSAIARVDLATRRISWPYPSAKCSGHSLSISNCGSFALCGDTAGNRVCKINLASGMVVGEYPLRLTQGVCVSPTLDFAFAGTTGTAVSRIDLESGAVEPNAYPRDASDTPFAGALGVAIAPNGRFALVANSRAESVSVIDLRPADER